MSARDFYWYPPCSIRLNPGVTDFSSMREELWASEAKLDAQSFAVEMISREIYPWAREFGEGIIPPAKGILILEPVKTGKSFLAGKFASMLFDHCSVTPDSRESISLNATETCSPITDPSHGAILELDVKKHVLLDDSIKVDSINNMKKMIVEHQIRRKGLGSVIIIKHIDRLPIEELDSFSEAMKVKSGTSSYFSPDAGRVSTNTDGTLFLFTSKTWGVNSIQEAFLDDRGKRTGTRRGSFINSIKNEIDRSTNSNFRSVSIDKWNIYFATHFIHFKCSLVVCFMFRLLNRKLQSLATIAPIFPFKESDLNFYLRHKIKVITAEHKGTRWRDVDVSTETVQFFAGPQYVDYDHYRVGNGNKVISYAICGAWSLDKGTLMNVLSAESLHARNPHGILVIDFQPDDESL